MHVLCFVVNCIAGVRVLVYIFLPVLKNDLFVVVLLEITTCWCIAACCVAFCFMFGVCMFAFALFSSVVVLVFNCMFFCVLVCRFCVCGFGLFAVFVCLLVLWIACVCCCCCVFLCGAVCCWVVADCVIVACVVFFLLIVPWEFVWFVLTMFRMLRLLLYCLKSLHLYMLLLVVLLFVVWCGCLLLRNIRLILCLQLHVLCVLVCRFVFVCVLFFLFVLSM